MSRKQDPRTTIADAGSALMPLAIDGDFNKAHPEAAAALRTAQFHLSIAGLWLTCPDAMRDAKALDRPTARTLLVENASAGNGSHPPPPPAVTRR